MSRLDQFTEATTLQDIDILHLKRSTGVNSDKKITVANLKIALAADFATAAQGALADSALQNVIDDTTPQLGGDFDCQDFDINSVATFTAADIRMVGTSANKGILVEDTKQFYIGSADAGDWEFFKLYYLTTPDKHDFYVQDGLEMRLTEDGLSVGNPTGGNIAPGMVNAKGFYVDGVAFTGGGGGLTPEFKTADFTAVAGKKYYVDTTSGAVEVTLPAGTDLDNIVIQDVGHSAGLNNITVTPNGVETIDNDTEFVIDQNEGDIDIAFNNSNSNWEVSSDGSPSLVNVNDFATGFSGTNQQTGTSYEFTEADLTKVVEANNAAASNYNIPDGVAADGETYNLHNIGAGLVTITATGTATLSSTANTVPSGDAVTIRCAPGDVYYVIGGT